MLASEYQTVAQVFSRTHHMHWTTKQGMKQSERLLQSGTGQTKMLRLLEDCCLYTA
jgi:hypothetical protein